MLDEISPAITITMQTKTLKNSPVAVKKIEEKKTSMTDRFDFGCLRKRENSGKKPSVDKADIKVRKHYPNAMR
jgi:hypothetical protein